MNALNYSVEYDINDQSFKVKDNNLNQFYNITTDLKKTVVKMSFTPPHEGVEYSMNLTIGTLINFLKLTQKKIKDEDKIIKAFSKIYDIHFWTNKIKSEDMFKYFYYVYRSIDLANLVVPIGFVSKYKMHFNKKSYTVKDLVTGTKLNFNIPEEICLKTAFRGQSHFVFMERDTFNKYIEYKLELCEWIDFKNVLKDDFMFIFNLKKSDIIDIFDLLNYGLYDIYFNDADESLINIVH